MATFVTTVPNFSLVSTWVVSENPIPPPSYVMSTPTTATATKTFNFAGLPANATVSSAVLSATLGSPLTGAALRQVDGVAFSGNLAVSVNPGGSKGYVFTFKANGDASVVGNRSSALAFSEVKITVTYTESGTPEPEPDQPSALTLSKTSCRAGEVIRYNITPGSSAYTHRIRAEISGKPSNNADVPAGQKYYDFTVPKHWQETIPNSTTATVTCTLFTYSGATLLGSSVKTFTMTLSLDAYPSIGSVTATHVPNGVHADFDGIYIQNKSRCTVTIVGAAGAYGSTIVSRKVVGNKQTINTSPAAFGVLTTSGSMVFLATVTDSRGRSRNASVTITVRPYNAPSLSGIEAYRCDAEGLADTAGAYIGLKATGAVTNIDNMNTYILQGRYAVKGGTWPAWTAMTDNTLLILGGTLLNTVTYEAQIRITDHVGTEYTFTKLIPAERPAFNLKDKGLGGAFGMFSVKDNALEMPWSLLYGSAWLVTGDWNTACGDRSGLFYNTEAMTNGPTSGAYIVLNMIGGTNRYQVAFCIYPNANIYARRYQNSTWSAWKQVGLT